MIARKLLIINFIAILGVVIHHSFHWVFSNIFFWWPEKFGIEYNFNTPLGQFSLYFFRSVDAIANVAVPIFLILTGYTITKVISYQMPYINNYRIVLGRLRNILVPYLIWTAIWTIFRIWQGELITLKNLTSFIFLGRAASEYYYIPILVQMYLIAPFWLRLTRKFPWVSLGVGIAINLLARIPFYLYHLTPATRVWWLEMYTNWQAPTYLIWFTCGVFFGINFNAIYSVIMANRKILYGLTGLALLAVITEVSWFTGQLGKPWEYSNSLLSSQIFSILLAACLVSLDLRKLPFQKQLMRFGTQSLGIYLIHSSILMLTAKIVFHVVPGLLRQPFMFQIILVMLGVGIPLLIIKLFDLTPMKRYSYILFG